MSDPARKVIQWQNEKTYKPSSEKQVLPAVPASHEAEQALIGAVLTDPSLFTQLRSDPRIKPEDFFYIKHGYIWRAFELIADNDSAIDITIVQEELRRVKHLDEIGGRQYLLQLVSATENTYNAPSYANIVKQASARRKLLKVGGDIQQLALGENVKVAQAYTDAHTLLNSVTAGELDARRSDIGTHLDAWLDRMERIIEQREDVMLPTGIKGIDDLFKGVRRRQMTILAAPTGFGKSTMVISSIGFNAARLGIPLVIMSNEEDEDEITSRFVSAEIGVPLTEVMTGNIPLSKYQVAMDAVDRLRALPVRFLYMPDMTPGAIRQELDSIEQEQPVHLLIIDGLKSIEPDVIGRGEEGQRRTKQLKDIMKALNKLAKDKNIPILAAHHFNRDEDGHSKTPPKIQNIAEGSAIEQYAQTIWALWRPPSDANDLVDEPGSQPTRLVSIKGRFTPGGEVPLRFESRGSYYTTDDRPRQFTDLSRKSQKGDHRHEQD